MLLPEGDALPERIKQKASADDELLGGVEPGMHAASHRRLIVAVCLRALYSTSEFWPFSRPVLKEF